MAMTSPLLPSAGNSCYHHNADRCSIDLSNIDIGACLPILRSNDYYTEPSVCELAAREASDPGYCSRVPDFVVGRIGYGKLRFHGHTDVRWMDLEGIVEFDGLSVAVYRNEVGKPAVGYGLNKPAEVTLTLQNKDLISVRKLRESCKRQGARFESFDSSNGEWKFTVEHFSRFGLIDDEDEDVVMDDVAVQPQLEEEKQQVNPDGLVLSHSLPAHLGLDPVKMHELRMLMFPADEDEDVDGSFPSDKRYYRKEQLRADSPSSSGRASIQKPLLHDSQLKSHTTMSPPVSKAPVPLLEYNVNTPDVSSSRNILMTGQNKGLPLRTTKVDGFKLEGKHVTPLTGKYADIVVDSALFMGRSFRVGWGPNGILVHTGTRVGEEGNVLSSVVNVEKVATDRVVRDAKNKIREELIDFCFSSPLSLHQSLDREPIKEVGQGLNIRLQKVIVDRVSLSEICRTYIGILEKQLEVSDLSMPSRVLLMHQVTIWELIKVLFSERETAGYLKNLMDDDDDEGISGGGQEDDMMLDNKDRSHDIDEEAIPLLRRSQFSYWLQDSVCHRVQEEVSCLNDSNELEHILLLMTGRQLDAAVELAASRGDVRLAILLSQSGGSTINRADMARQLDVWRTNGLDFSFIEDGRLKLYELLAGNIEGAVKAFALDWKRYLGSIMWYQIPPDASLSDVINRYEHLLGEGRAPHPVPVYIDEGPIEDTVQWRIGDRYDIAYYLMLLHASEKKPFSLLKNMFSAFSSTFDPLDYHMIWHQQSILQAIGAFSSNDLHVVDMSHVSQLLSLGQCHWAIYVVLHLPYRKDYPFIQESAIREILFQHCETWSTHEIQRQFIEDLGVPTAWMHEALAMYYQYYGDLPVALEHFLECFNWQKAHSIFMTAVAPSLFLSSKDADIWRITSTMEEHKSEIADWEIGAGIYIDYYILKTSLQEDVITSEDFELDPLEVKNKHCKEFFSRLSESLELWGSRLPIEARATYSKMAEELGRLLVSTPGESSTPSIKMNCFQTLLSAPIPEDLRSCHLQEAISVFTFSLTEATS